MIQTHTCRNLDRRCLTVASVFSCVEILKTGLCEEKNFTYSVKEGDFLPKDVGD